MLTEYVTRDRCEHGTARRRATNELASALAWIGPATCAAAWHSSVAAFERREKPLLVTTSPAAMNDAHPAFNLLDACSSSPLRSTSKKVSVNFLHQRSVLRHRHKRINHHQQAPVDVLQILIRLWNARTITHQRA